MKHPLILLGDIAPVGLSAVSLSAFPDKWKDTLILANLETPLCAPHLPPRPKAGPTLRGTPESLRSLVSWHRLVLSHANNHAMDYGPAGLEQTQTAVQALGIPLIGAGVNLTAAADAHVFNYRGLRTTILSVTEPWFGIATPTQAGVHALEPRLTTHLRNLKPQTDRLIVSVHGGSEMSPWPSPRWQANLRSFIDAGADVVHAHHPHVLQGWEQWGRGWIFYGLGNTLINPASWSIHPRTRCSWSAQVDLSDLSRPPRIEAWTCIPETHDTARIAMERIAPPEAAELAAHNTPLTDAGLLAGLHQEYSLHLWHTFYSDRLGLGKTLRQRGRLLLRSLFDSVLAVTAPKQWHEKKRQRALFHYHLFKMPGHADEISTALGLLGGELPDLRNETTHQLAQSWLPKDKDP